MPRGKPGSGKARGRPRKVVTAATAALAEVLSADANSLVSFKLPSGDLVELSLPLKAVQVSFVKVSAPAGTIVKWMVSDVL